MRKTVKVGPNPKKEYLCILKSTGIQKEPTYRSIWKLALPAMLGGVVEPILTLTDMAVVGNIGYDSFTKTNENISAVAAVGIAGSLISALTWIFAQMKSADRKSVV